MLIGLTGSIGSGKTTVAELLRSFGAYVIDADRVAREAVDQEPEIQEQLIRAFGSDLRNPDGTLRRRELGRRAFATKEGRDRLNAIVHPSVLQRIREYERRALEEDADRAVVVDAPLIVECGMVSEFDVILVVAAPEEQQRARVKARTGLSDREIESRLRAQAPVSEKIAVADHVIHNDRDIGHLRCRAREVWETIIQGAGV